MRYAPGDHKDDYRFLFEGHSHLLTEDERTAYRNLITRMKIANAESASMKRMMRDRWLSTDLNVLTLLEAGESEFFDMTIKRVIREKFNDLNRCPMCGSLCRTSKACLCPHCNHTWFEKRHTNEAQQVEAPDAE